MSGVSKPLVGVIDYGIGNLRSLVNAFLQVRANVVLVRDPDQLAEVERVVLPGVGSFSAAMENFTSKGWTRPFLDSIAHRIPVMGICVGMQMLFDVGLENGETRGLGVISGRVERFPLNRRFKVPHVGWNSLDQGPAEHHVLASSRPGVDVYFCHSFICKPIDEEVVLRYTEHGVSFASAVSQGNVLGLQFHPEKSQTSGLQILRTFSG